MEQKKTVKNKEIGNGEPPIFEKTCLVSMTYHLFNRRLTLCLTKRVPLCEMDITAVLQVLVRDGLLTQQNQRRWASYRVAGDSPQLADDFPPWEGNSPQSSPQLGPDSPQLPSNSPQLDRLAGLSAEIQALRSFAEPARKNKKLPVDQLKGVIQLLCHERWLSTSELAALVDRDAEKLQSRFLTAMVREGILELRYPEVRNRPDQAYRTVSKSL